MFCPKCGALMRITGKKQAQIQICRCGYHSNLILKDKIHEKKEIKHTHPDIAYEDRSVNRLASYDHVCEKCKYTKAEVIVIGTQIGDEDEVVNLKCGKCGAVSKLEGQKNF